MGVVELVGIRNLINRARRETLLMFVALQQQDRIQAVFAATRARIALAGAERQFAAWAGDVTGWNGVGELLAAVRAWAQPGLDECALAIRSCREFYECLAHRSASGVNAICADDAILSVLDLDDLDLSGATFRRARIEQCHMVTSTLSRGCFDEAKVDRSDLSRTNLERSRWCGAVVTGSRLAGAVMIDTTLDGARFVECDLRGVDLSIVNRGELATSLRAEFVRCDLRESKWCRRVLSGARLIDCKLYGSHGPPVLDGTEIERSDLSSKGDGSMIVPASEVVRLWEC